MYTCCSHAFASAYRVPSGMALVMAVLLLVARLAAADTFKPPVDATAVPLTKSLGSIRTATNGVALQWSAQATKTAYAAYLRTFRKPLTNLVCIITWHVGVCAQHCMHACKHIHAHGVWMVCIPFTRTALPPIQNSTSKINAFKRSLKEVIAYNNNTRLNWAAGLNAFADMTASERARYRGLAPPRSGTR